MLIKRILGGTALILGGVAIFIGLAGQIFKRRVDGEIRAMMSGINLVTNTSVRDENLASLPEPVKKYLSLAIDEGQPVAQFVRLKQSGVFKTGEQQPWLPIEAEQYFATKRPAFIWRAQLRMPLALWVSARDKYVNGHGNMLIKLLSAIPIGNVRGPEMDVSTLLRYLSEMPWFPTAFASNDFLAWEAIDPHAAKVTIRDGDLSATGVFYFNDAGQITRFVTDDRYQTVGNAQVKTRWVALYSNYQKFGGLTIPATGEVSWQPNGENRPYARLNITQVEFNLPELY